ncbi:MAG: hypothetical protein C5B55_04130 [Blastocatellia bacterium]|nr:MAG: hypothetical protein C5B55_04130 [Blastocatellia bacterium]
MVIAPGNDNGATPLGGYLKRSKTMRATHYLNNPFVNRFNDPVTRRCDEMQSDEYMVWLRERNEGDVVTAHVFNATKHSMLLGRLFAPAFGLLILIVSFVVLLKVM